MKPTLFVVVSVVLLSTASLGMPSAPIKNATAAETTRTVLSKMFAASEVKDIDTMMSFVSPTILAKVTDQVCRSADEYLDYNGLKKRWVGDFQYYNKLIRTIGAVVAQDVEVLIGDGNEIRFAAFFEDNGAMPIAVQDAPFTKHFGFFHPSTVTGTLHKAPGDNKPWLFSSMHFQMGVAPAIKCREHGNCPNKTIDEAGAVENFVVEQFLQGTMAQQALYVAAGRDTAAQVSLVNTIGAAFSDQADFTYVAAPSPSDSINLPFVKVSNKMEWMTMLNNSQQLRSPTPTLFSRAAEYHSYKVVYGGCSSVVIVASQAFQAMTTDASGNKTVTQSLSTVFHRLHGNFQDLYTPGATNKKILLTGWTVFSDHNILSKEDEVYQFMG